MAFEDRWVQRYKAQGFYRHVEWETDNGFLIRVFDPDRRGFRVVTFESGRYDKEYDQRFSDYRQWWVSKREAVQMMLNMGFNIARIAKIFRSIDAGLTVKELI